jgi:hypothetical protein
MSAKTSAIHAIYAQVAAPRWAARNLDGLTDVLRDLSWLPEGPVLITLPDLGQLSGDDRAALLDALGAAAQESIDTERPVRFVPG